jgi:hypothetical protein
VIRPAAAAIAAVLFAGPPLVAEMGTRALIRFGRLPDAPSSDLETDVSLANLRRKGRPDVLVVGTSSIRSGLRPNVLEELILDETGRAATVQNVGQAALSLEGHRILVAGLARHDLVPRTVILGLTPSTMTGYGRSGEWFPDSELGRYWNGRHELVGEASLVRALGRRSAFWRWRREGQRLSDALLGAAGRSTGTSERRLTPSGWLSERPVKGLTLEQRVPRMLEILPAGVPLPQHHLDSFVSLIAELRALGARVVAVALPYAPQLESALVARNPQWYAERDAGYTALGEAAGLPIIIVRAYGAWWNESSQNDLRHLSRRGAGPMTRQLWQDPAFREPILEGLASAG